MKSIIRENDKNIFMPNIINARLANIVSETRIYRIDSANFLPEITKNEKFPRIISPS
jgi:hypothetical protein